LTAGLHLKDLKVMHGHNTVVSVTAHVAPGEVLSVMGPSGSGKSTLLAALTGTLAQGFRASGQILLDGQDITTLPTNKRRIGILFQDALLFPHLSVGGNLGFALPAGTPDRQARIEDTLEAAGLPGFAQRDPATLSGGERARVALMRTLLAKPRALLLDEPFSALDSDLRARTRAFVLTQIRTLGLPAILVTHDPEDAKAAGPRVIRPLGELLPNSWTVSGSV
jgi:putative thiamine transport system ATP-binding protein